ncbi:hypothetical protein EMCRGX_G034611 [Ephydatia muelleri]
MSSNSSGDSSPESSRSFLGTQAEGVSAATEVASFTNLRILEPNNQIRELQTILRDVGTTRSDFVFYADRLAKEGLNCLPSYKRTVTTPTGHEYEGEWFEKMNCGVSIMRNGEAMEKGLRDCCRSMRIGKILIRRELGAESPRVYYAKFPPQIENRQILLLYPALETGATVVTALHVLKEHGAKEKKIVIVTLFSTPQAVKNILTKFPDVKMLTSEVHRVCPTHFGLNYFGSD